MASLLSQCDPGKAKAAACPRNTAKGTDRAARTASAALTALDLAAELTQDAIPAAATSAMNPQVKVTASIPGSGSTPPRAISTTPCVSHKAPPTSAAQAATPRRLITELTVSHEREDTEAARVNVTAKIALRLDRQPGRGLKRRPVLVRA